MNNDTPTIEKLKQKVQSSGMKFERGGMNPLLQWSIENIIAPAMFRDKKEQGTLTATEAMSIRPVERTVTATEIGARRPAALRIQTKS